MIRVTHPVVLWWRAIYGLLMGIGLIIIALVYFGTIQKPSWLLPGHPIDYNTTTLSK